MFRNSLSGLFATLLLCGASAACEGEPPKVPSNAALPPEPSPSAQPTDAQAPALAATGNPAQRPLPGTRSMPCADMMSTPAASATAPPPSASAAPAPTAPAAGAAGAVDSAPAASPQPAAAHANITGVVTTTPAKSAGLAVVYLENAPVVAGRGALAGVDNRQMSFQPFVSVIAVGGKVAFSNSDPFPHNVFSPDHERFDVGSVAAHATGAHVFKTPGTYSLLCNLHPNMLGYVLVSPSSYFAKANAKGEFTIKDVPPGTYQATAWAPRLTSVTQTVVVATGDAQLAFTLHR